MLTIKEIRLTNIEIKIEDGKRQISGKYMLIGDTGKIIAKQAFGEYSDIKLELSREAITDIENLTDTITTEIELLIGMNEAVKELKGGINVSS